jgi:regulator of protease activity HflC (stomatin/prohibitin superfamily)
VISTLLDYLLDFSAWVWRLVRGFVKNRPVESALIALAIIRSFGTIVQTGQAGVLFFCGRVRKVLEPGFHPLIPILHYVRKVPVRSVTLDLPKQRVANADGLVYDVDTSIVYRIEDPVKTVTLVDNYTTAITNVVPLVVQELLREQTRAELSDRQALDAELTQRCIARLAAWGLTVEQAGMSSIAPTRRTIRLSQLRARVLERQRLMRQIEQEGAAGAVAVLLASGGPMPLGHAATRYRRHRRLRLLKRRLTPPTPTKAPLPTDPKAQPTLTPASPAAPAAGDNRR